MTLLFTCFFLLSDRFNERYDWCGAEFPYRMNGFEKIPSLSGNGWRPQGMLVFV